MKLKLKKSLRIKKRYLLLEAASRDQIEKTILEYIGVLGWAKAAPEFPQLFKYKTEKIVLAVATKSLVDIRAAFEMSLAKIKVLKISGTLKGLLGKN